MGNTLLDFVMALARDREAAARYAADPSGALAAAGLTGVTAADVAGLMPMVADSIAATTPAFGVVPPGGGGSNVWTSGAATAAFDAFDVHRPDSVLPAVIRPDSALQPTDPVVPSEPVQGSLPGLPGTAEPQLHDPFRVEDDGHGALIESAPFDGAHHPDVPDGHPSGDGPSFDLF